ncbi:MAG: tRNA threonylcarbamoyladenosine biosynthesis protein TsaE [Parcubacteria group bacterium ADurb.Bin326]|nr:MAG: tRNA threonylcarbamoyladenosine biosynthesis protein TsaE [Parcubacteria group bacterium ADurb.Bin326]
MKFLSTSEKQTLNFAKKFAGKLKGGEVLCLVGDLGAGKTAFTKGLAAGLGVKNTVTSPTFVLMKNYKVSGKGIKHLAHIDAYRLEGGAQLLGIGAEDYFGDAECVTVIEWADRVKDIWPKDAIKIEFKIGKGDKREINIR